jgi:DNA polymerase-3 subunit gamma/tau
VHKEGAVARNRATSGAAPDGQPTRGDGYTVVARRYRPQRFEDVVGQDHVVQALRNAIALNRVTHAYVFSGTRGVGKTSMARIFAKCLNCVHGPTTEPCNACEICRDISVGQDVDVIEIDGASNNGVESVRELRQNAGLRPSRARFKIYYIDEVHMLSTGAFNALLKTLEEPPEHVKFFFATTEPNKIPITVLSRCQRYDFAGIKPEQILESLAAICEREGVAVEPEALRVVARRASGSMRDAQSLLEQLLSSGNQTLTAEVVHRALGLASDERVLDLIEALAGRDPAGALQRLDAAVGGGVQPADLLAELIEFLRDVMVLAAGAPEELAGAPPSQRGRLKAVAGAWSLDSILAALQILGEARGRLRGSPNPRLVVEVALCRVARLEDFAELGELIGRLAAGGNGEAAPASVAPAVKKKPLAPEPPPPVPTPVEEPARSRPAPAPPSPRAEGPRPLTLEGFRDAWPELCESLGAPEGSHLARFAPAGLPEPGVLAVAVPADYNWAADVCERPESRGRIEAALRGVMGRPLILRFERAAARPDAPARPASLHPAELDSDPLVQAVVQRFEARAVKVELDDGAEGA